MRVSPGPREHSEEGAPRALEGTSSAALIRDDEMYKSQYNRFRYKYLMRERSVPRKNNTNVVLSKIRERIEDQYYSPSSLEKAIQGLHQKQNSPRGGKTE